MAHGEPHYCEVRIVAHSAMVSYDAIHERIHDCDHGATAQITVILDEGAQVEETEVASKFCDLRYQIIQRRDEIISETSCILR